MVRSITKTYHNKSDRRPLLFLASCDRSFLSPSPKMDSLARLWMPRKGVVLLNRPFGSFLLYFQDRESFIFLGLSATRCGFKGVLVSQCLLFGLWLLDCMHDCFFSMRPFSKKNCVVNIFSIVFDYYQLIGFFSKHYTVVQIQTVLILNQNQRWIFFSFVEF